MHFKPKTLVWSLIAVLCVIGLVLVWFVGFPVPDYVASDDGCKARIYTIQIAPYTYFDVGMSSQEKLARTDYETYYGFTGGSIAKTSTQLKADVINGQKQVFGRPGGFLYRIFDECTIQVTSERSTIQAYNSLITGEPYRVEGYFDALKPSKERMPELPSKDEEYIVPFEDGIYGAYMRSYSYDRNTGTLLYLDDNSNFYRVQTVYGVQYDVVNQLLATARACYGLDITEYWAGDNFVLFMSGDWVLGVHYINRNTQRVVVSNNAFSRYPALLTICGGDEIGQDKKTVFLHKSR